MSLEDLTICDDVEIERRVEQIRKRREEEAEAEKNRLRDLRLTWEAEAVIAFENVNVMNEITDDTDLFEYVSSKLRSHDTKFDKNTFECMYNPSDNCRSSTKLINITCNRGGGVGISCSSYHRNPRVFPFNHQGFKIKYLVNKIKATKETSEYKEREALRKKLIEEQRILTQKALEEEQNILKEKAFQEEQVRRQGVIDEANTNIKNIINERENTFTELQLSDWDKPRQREFLLKENHGGWGHYIACVGNKTFNRPDFGSCNEGMNDSFINYFEEGKVPFCTKCPVCKIPTKINYLNKCYSSGWGINTQNTHEFNEVYCDNHYFYDSGMNKHYVLSADGIEMQFPPGRPKLSQNTSYTCWSPPGTYIQTGISGVSYGRTIWSKWKEWDPSDPDGSNAEAEKKKKEADEIQKQISELQAKLAAL